MTLTVDQFIQWAQDKYGDQPNYEEIKMEGASSGLSPHQITQVMDILESISGMPVNATSEEPMPKVTIKVLQNGEPVTKEFLYDEDLEEFRSFDNPVERYNKDEMDEIRVRESRSNYDRMAARNQNKEINVSDKELLKKKADMDEPLNVDWENEMYGAPAPKTIEVDDAGVWIEPDDPDMGWKVQQIAKKYGWPGIIIEEGDEEFLAAVDEAQEYLASAAPANYRIGNDESGAWGMFEEGVHPSELPGPEMMPQHHEPQAPEMTEREKMDLAEEPSEFEEWENRLAELAEKKDEGTLTPEEQKEMDLLNEELMKSPAMSMESSIKTEAQAEPPYEAPMGKVWKEVNGKLVLMDQEAARTASIKQEASEILSHVTVLSEFADELHPRVAGQIKEGDRVFLDNVGIFGNVVRVLDEGVYRVEAADRIATYFELEVSKRD